MSFAWNELNAGGEEGIQRMSRTTVVMMLAVVAAAMAIGGGQAASAPPLRISQRIGTAGITLEMQNVSGQPVAAYAVRLVRQDESGKTISVRTHSTATRGLGMSYGRPSFQPGEKWNETVSMPEGAPTLVQLDLVLFEDGTYWGPNKSRELERFLGMKAGARFEREAAARQK